MQPFSAELLNPASTVVAGALLAAAWQGAVLTALIALILRLVPGITATFRSLAWTAVLLVVIVLHLEPAFIGRSLPLGHAATPHGLQLDPRWAVALLSLWSLLSAWRLAHLLRSALRLRTIARRAIPVVVDPSISVLLHRGPRSVELCVSHDVDRPSVCGFLSPRILLPPDLFESLATPELLPIVLHEMEHLRRRDDWLNLFGKLSLALLPLNPALLWIERQLCLERELACDDGVLRITHARKAYATCLARLAEHAIVSRGLTLALGAWRGESELTRRVQRILARPRFVLARSQASAVAALFALALAGGATWLSHAPQLVSFAQATSTAASAPQLRAASTPAVSRDLTSGAHLINASMQIQSTSHAAPRRATGPSHRTAFSPRRHRARRVLPASASWLVLTEYHADRDLSPRGTHNLTETGFSYAAVPLGNGWLIVQL